MKIEFETEKKLIKLIPEIHDKSNLEFSIIGKITLVKTSKYLTQLADIRDYFLYQTINCDNKKDAEKIIENYLEYGLMLDDHPFYVGFFFTLSQILSLKYEIKSFEFEKITYDDFKKSFEETLKNLGLR